MWQKCPICEGTGKTGEILGYYKVKPACKTCLGTGIINTITGKPPVENKEDFRDLQQGESQQDYFGK